MYSQFVDDKSVKSCQNLLSTGLLNKLCEQVVTSQQMTSCNKPGFQQCGGGGGVENLLNFLAPLPNMDQLDYLVSANVIVLICL